MEKFPEIPVFEQEDLEILIIKARKNIAEGKVFSFEEVKKLAKTWGRKEVLVKEN